MIVHIISFREYVNYKVKISNKGITLLSGVSGTGKTTILRAIRWCLYGGSASGEKYEVKIKYLDLKIVRKSKPSILQVTRDGIITNGDIATQHITDLFGPEDLFDLCCYMRQGDFPCPLVSSVAKTRLYYLSKLAFKDKLDPTLLIEAIMEQLRKVKELHKQKNIIYEDHQKALVYLDSRFNLPSDIVTIAPDNVNNCIEKLLEEMRSIDEEIHHNSQLITEIDTANAIANQRLSKLAQTKAAIENNKKELERQLSKRTFGTVNEDEYHKIENEIEVLKLEKISLEELQQKRRLQDIITKFKKCQDKLSGGVPGTVVGGGVGTIPGDVVDSKFTERDYFALEIQTKEYEDNSETAKRYGIEYSKEAVSKAIETLKRYNNYIRKKDEYKDYVKLSERFNTLKSEEDIAIEEKKLQDMKRSLDLLICPHCEGLVRCKDNILVAAGHGAFAGVSEPDVKKQQIKVESLQLVTKERRTLGTKIDIYKEKDIHLFEEDGDMESIMIKDIDKRILSLLKLKIVKKPTITLATARNILEYNKAAGEMNSNGIDLSANLEQPIIEKTIDEIKNVILTTNKNIKELESKLLHLKQKGVQMKAQEKEHTEMLNKLSATIQVLSSQVEEQEREISKHIIRDNKHIKDAIAVLRTKRSDLEKKVVQLRQLAELSTKRQELEVESSELNEIVNDMRALSDLYENALAEHYKSLQEVVDQINSCIELGVDVLFPYPLTLEVSLTPPGKDEKRFKHNVGFTIIKKGKDHSCRNPEDEFSGGEMKRLILLIVIALNTLYKAPILMLDEMFASLDPEFRHECLQLIKTYINDRIVLSAEHYAEKGDYDYYIDLMPTNAQ